MKLRLARRCRGAFPLSSSAPRVYFFFLTTCMRASSSCSPPALTWLSHGIWGEVGSHIIALALLPLARDVVEKTQGFLFVDPNLLSCCHPLLPSSTVSRGSEGSGGSGPHSSPTQPLTLWVTLSGPISLSLSFFLFLKIRKKCPFVSFLFFFPQGNWLSSI